MYIPNLTESSESCSRWKVEEWGTKQYASRVSSPEAQSQRESATYLEN